MGKNEITPINQSFLDGVSNVLVQARKNAKTAVNLSMVYAYYEIGRMIIEEEQHGQNRAAYGKQILRELSKYLTEKYGNTIVHSTSVLRLAPIRTRFIACRWKNSCQMRTEMKVTKLGFRQILEE